MTHHFSVIVVVIAASVGLHRYRDLTHPTKKLSTAWIVCYPDRDKTYSIAVAGKLLTIRCCSERTRGRTLGETERLAKFAKVGPQHGFVSYVDSSGRTVEYLD